MFEIQGKYTKALITVDHVEDSALAQIYEMVNHPAAVNPIAIMPDVHAGSGCVIGFTMMRGDKIVPHWIGVDIGCGMRSARFKSPPFGPNVELDLDLVDDYIGKNVPMGKNVHSAGIFKDNFIAYMQMFQVIQNEDEILEILNRIDMDASYFYRSLGTLGGGNHFIEIGKEDNEDDSYWTTIHSGSRNFGLKVANYWHEIAKQKSGLTSSPYLKGDDVDGYLYDMKIAQYYAKFNRQCIQYALDATMQNQGFVPVHFFHDIPQLGSHIETCHNYISNDDYIIRKGAISAYEGEWVVVPFNMRDGLLICKGKGNIKWNMSGPHGAGRILSRGNAKRQVTLEEFKDSMKGIYSSCIDESRIDESPMAYKDASIIENAIEPSLEIIYRVKPIYNRKG